MENIFAMCAPTVAGSINAWLRCHLALHALGVNAVARSITEAANAMMSNAVG